MAEMFKNQLQELAQRSCFNLPSYSCIREGPDHAPRFKASVNFNGEIFETPTYCNTLRQAEHEAAEVALNALSLRVPSWSLAAGVLDETGVYKNLLQETAHKVGLKLPVYTTVRSGPGHVPVFTCTVELAGMNFTGDPAKTKKQAEKNAAIAAWSSLKTMPNLVSLHHTSKITGTGQKRDQRNVARIRRNQNQEGRRMVGVHRDTRSSNSLKHQEKRFMESASEGLTPKKSCFVSLLPPPPPHTSSNTLPKTSSSPSPSVFRPNHVPVMGKSQVKMNDLPPLLDEYQRDEDEWVSWKSELIKLPIENDSSKSTSSLFYQQNSTYSPFTLFHAGNLNSSIKSDHRTPTEKTRMEKRLPGPSTQSQMAISLIKAPPTCSSQKVRKIHNGGYYFQERRIAPAVQIRSVIPVCAAPPPPPVRPIGQPSNPPLMKEAASATSTSSHGGVAEVSSATSPKFNKLQLYSNEIISMFNKKLQF